MISLACFTDSRTVSPAACVAFHLGEELGGSCGRLCSVLLQNHTSIPLFWGPDFRISIDEARNKRWPAQLHDQRHCLQKDTLAQRAGTTGYQTPGKSKGMLTQKGNIPSPCLACIQLEITTSYQSWLTAILRVQVQLASRQNFLIRKPFLSLLPVRLFFPSGHEILPIALLARCSSKIKIASLKQWATPVF